MKERDQYFLQSINTVYDNFNFDGSNGEVSCYAYMDNHVENIPTGEKNSDIAFFVHKKGAYIFVDYSLIEPRLFDEMIDGIKTVSPVAAKAKSNGIRSDEQKIGRYAAARCFEILANRECRNDFDKEKEEFKI